MVQLREAYTAVLAPIEPSDIASPSLRHFHRALRHRRWTADLDWEAPSTLTRERQILACHIASQASHAEQIGMLTAATLLLEARDPVTRLALATAVRDESIHTHTFALYSNLRGGTIHPPVQAHDLTEEWLLSTGTNFVERLLMHALAEGFATDQFYFFARAFRDDLLGHIYRGVLSDESRHVMLGLEAVACVAATNATRIDLRDVRRRALDGSGTDDELFRWIAEVAGAQVNDVRMRYMNRLDARLASLQQLISLKKECSQMCYQTPLAVPGYGPKKSSKKSAKAAKSRKMSTGKRAKKK